jgi:hypothetical protein
LSKVGLRTKIIEGFDGLLFAVPDRVRGETITAYTERYSGFAPIGASSMSILDPSEKVEFLAIQSLHYDRYSERQYFLERVQVNGKCGLVYGEQSDEYGIHLKVLCPPVYNEIKVSKISSRKAIYDKYIVFTNGNKLMQFTLGLNTWVLIDSQRN